MIYEASISGVLRIILWLILISFIIRLIARLATPYVVKKAEETLRNRAAQYEQQRRPPRAKGEVTIETNARGKSKNSEGEFVDYVEIKD